MNEKVFIFVGIFLILGVVFVTAETINLKEEMRVKITSPLESNGAIPVNIQDQHSRALDLFFVLQKSVTTLSSNATIGDTEIIVTSTTDFTDGSYIGIFSGESTFYFGEQLGGPSGNTITLDTPLDRNFTAGELVLTSQKEMNVDGSSTTQIFKIGPIGEEGSVEIDITRVMGYLQDGSAMDDSKFGGMNALTNGIVMRRNDGVIDNYWNAKSNGDLALLTFDFQYSDKAKQGSYGARFRNTYAGPSKHGVTIRLEAGDTLELLIQDDLTDLEDFHMVAQGHVVTD